MITARPQKQLKAAKSYFREHLGQGDYYSEKQTIAGQWFGRGAERLGLDLAAPVSEAAFLRLCDNQHPATGRKLTARQRRERRVFYDFPISALKSTSIMALTMRDARILVAHHEAGVEVIRELEKAAAVRVRRGGQRGQRTTGEIVAAAFRHDASRALDPQLHTHLVVFNATYDPVEKAWRALEAEPMFAQSRYLTEVYRNALAMRLTALGYQLRTTANGFEIEGVSEELIMRFSKRRQAMVAAEAKLVAQLGQKLTNNGRAAVAHATRERKRRDLGSDELVAHQRAQMSAVELAALTRLIPGERSNRIPAVTAPSLAAGEVIRRACDHVFERLSVAEEHQILTEALRFARGVFTPEQLRTALAANPGLVRKDGTVTTLEAQAQEKRLIDQVNASIGSCAPLHRGFAAASTLSDEQRQVVDTVLRSTDGVIGVRGGAGTGKTFALREVARGIEARGKTVQLLAPTGGAVDVLREDGFRQADTVQRFLVDPALQERTRGQVLMVDEAGLLSVRQLLALVEAGQRQGCRMILCGDVRQHTSVEAGDGLRVLQTRSHLHTAKLNQIRRQVGADYRQAIAEMADGHPHRALARLEKIGAVAVIEGEERHQRLATDYAASLKAGKSALIVSPTWREITEVTVEVRAALKQSTQLRGQDTEVEVHVPKRWTKAEKRDFRSYRPGQVLTFHQSTRDFARGEWARVVSVKHDQLVVKKPGGDQVTLTCKQSGCYDVAEAARLPVARGERLLLQASRREARLLNGQLVTVKSARRDGQITLTDGRVIPPDFRQFTHGYCVTSPAAQGKTADHVYVAVDARSGPAANLKQFYVSASRGREKVKIYTDDLERLREALGRTGDRLSALEFLQKAELQETPAPRVRLRPG